MTRFKTKRFACGFGTLLLASLLSTGAYAQTHFLDPNVLGPRARARALHGPLGDTNPWGEPSAIGCRWSRIQVPTAQGLRWMVMEECDNSNRD